jgi:transposase InsO family protein
MDAGIEAVRQEIRTRFGDVEIGERSCLAQSYGHQAIMMTVRGLNRNLFSRRVVGWSMQPDIRRNLVINALQMAWLSRSPDKTAGLMGLDRFSNASINSLSATYDFSTQACT